MNRGSLTVLGVALGAALLLCLARGASAAEFEAKYTYDKATGLLLRLPKAWRAGQVLGMHGYQDPATPQYAFWVSVQTTPRSERSQDEHESAEDFLRSMLLSPANPVAPVLLRLEAASSWRAVAMTKPTRGPKPGNTQYQWTVMELTDSKARLGSFTLSVIDSRAEAAKTEELVALLWKSIESCQFDASPPEAPPARGAVRSDE